MSDSRVGNEREEPALTTAQDNMLREKLAAERKAVSNANFGLGMVSLLLLVGLIAGGVWYFSVRNTANPVGTAAMNSGVVAVSTSSAKSSDVSAPERTPAVIHVPPAPGNP